MRLREQRLWDSMRNNKPPHIFIERIENGVGEGTPDVHGISRNTGRTVWVELKAQDAFPARAATPVLGLEGLRTSQRNWLDNWWRFGGLGGTLIGVGRAARRELFFVPAIHSVRVNDMTRAQLIQFRAIDWPCAFNLIFEEL